MKGVENLRVRQDEGSAIIVVKVVAGSSRDGVVGVLGDALKVATSAAAERGKANAAVARTLAEAFGVDKRRVELISGRTSPRKEFHIAGMTPKELRKKLLRL